MLPIQLSPEPASAFKAALLRTKLAWITVHYADGRRETKPWRAPNITRNSNIIGNLRTRSEFRSGYWQASGIVRVDVSIDRPAAPATS